MLTKHFRSELFDDSDNAVGLLDASKDYFIDSGILCKHTCIYLIFCMVKLYYLSTKADSIVTVVKELRSKMFGQHPGYSKAVFLKQTRIIIVSIYKYTGCSEHERGCLSSLNPRSKSATDLHSSDIVYKKYIISKILNLLVHI
jgi:hypothetical protein